MKPNDKNKIINQSIILSVIFFSIVFFINSVSAADNTYYWTPSSGAIDSSGFTANWGSCGALPTSYRITTLSSTGFTCNSDRLTRTSSGDQFLAILPTAYGSDTQITGKTGATFYLSSQRSGYTATYRFDLGYARSGTFTSLGYVTQSVGSSSGSLYTIDLSSISGTAPSGSYLALKVSVTTSRGGRVYLGTNGGSTGSNSGRFYVSETAATPPAPTYNVSISASPASTDITAGNSYSYNIIVNNTGNANGNYTLGVTDSDTVNFTNSTLGTTAMQINSGGSAQTTLTVTAKVSAVIGAIDNTIITVRSVENSIYTTSTQVQTTVINSTYSASAVDMTYYWTPSSGAIGSSGFTANWGSCGALPTSYRITTLSSTGFTCNSDRLTRTSSGDQFLAIFPTAYSSDTQIKGKAGATFYLSSQRSGYTATYRFDLGYARSGTFTSLGYVTQSATSTARSYTINMSSISGTAPSGSYPALKVSVTTSQGGRVYLGTNGGSTGSNSGRFYVSETAATPPAPTYNVSISASPASTDITAGNSYSYNIIVNNTGNANGNYTLSVTDSDTVNFTNSTLGTATMQINSGGSAQTTLTVTAKVSAVIGAIDNTAVTVRSVENSIYTNSTQAQTTVTAQAPPPGTGGQVIVKANRYVVLDDPNAGTAAPGFFSPSDVTGGNWGTNYWSGESTTIRASAVIMSSGGSRLPGVTVTFKLINPAGSTIHTASSITDGDGAAYYSYDLNSKNYWGNWKIDANATVGGTGIVNGTSFALYWWGCGQCHGPENPGNWGTKYTPKSYYTMGYDFHRSQNKQKHTETMEKGNCVTCHQMYGGIPIDRGYTGNTPSIYVENEYSPDWHNGKVTCQGCHAGSNISTTPQRKNPEIAGCYDTPGCHPKKNTNLSGFNSTTGYVVGGNYRTVYSNIPSSASAHTVTSVKCILCHGAGHNITKPYNVSSTSNANTENDQCWACHTQRQTTHYGTNCAGCHSQDVHSVSVSGGGPDCISCHGLGGSAAHKVDENAIAAGVHSNLNSQANANVSSANKKCWGCHQSDGNQPTGMGDRYNNPYKCYECHNLTKPYARVSGAMTISEHYKNGTDIKAGIFAISNSASCALCHSVSEMKVAYTDNEFSNLSLASHYGKNRSGTLDCKYCHQNTSTAFTAAMMSNIENDNLTNHSSSPSTPVCTTCHGSGMLHDSSLTKPASSNDSYCKTCHSDRNEHKTVYCTECHANNTDRSQAGRELHGINFLQKDNTFSQNRTGAVDCTTCHQSDAVNSSLILPPPKISDPLHHTDDVNNGSKWGDYWTNPIGACLYCHNDTKHSTAPLGRPLTWNPSYILNATIGSGTNCADCHYKGNGNYPGMQSAYTSSGLSIPPEITSGSWNGKPGYYNHTLSDYTDSQCKSCHDKAGSTTVGQLMHNVSIGTAGGPDCISCHGSGGSATHKVDVTAMATGEHSNLNSGATANGVSADNKKCWGCHQSDGTQPTDMGDRYNNPYKCYDCHNSTKPYANINSAPTVSEHFKNGTDIYAASSAFDDSESCILCHNITEMKVSYAESDGLNTQYSLPSHYGRNRSDLRIGDSTDCKYCHQNTSTVFSGAMNNTANNNMSNHSTLASTPVCTTCHGSGKIHDSSLSKPASSDSAYCKTCHATKSEHRTLYCAECHTNNTPGSLAGREIHGIEYLQKDNTFSTDKTNAVDCTTCHQSSIVDSSIGTTPIKISNPLHHSDDILNGSKWGSYWTDPAGACLYCHSDTKHNATPLGRPLIWNPSYVLNTAIGSGTNCADCHYKGNGNYGNMTSVYTSASLEKPPEITNGSWNDKPGYYNHTLSDYTDSQCKSCHDKAGSTTVGQLMHNVPIGTAGGPDCISCHGSGGSATHKVDVTAMATGEHSNLNSGATANGVSADNKKCWGCHQSDGTQPTDMGDRYNNPYKCYDCHNSTKPYANINSAPTVSEHFKNGTDIYAAQSATSNSESCILCHNITEMKVSYTESDGLNTGYSTSSHYGKNRSDLRIGGSTDCKYCHQNTSTVFSGAMNNTANNNMLNHSTLASTPVCTTCHGSGKLHDSSLTRPASSNDSYCKTCHSDRNEHKTVYCTECHANNIDRSQAGREIHGINFLQKDNTFSQNRTGAVDCTTCHQSDAVNSSLILPPPKISDPLHHSDDVNSGLKWGSYWSSPVNACIYCHNDTKHSLTPLGRPLIWNPSYVLNTAIGSGTNCADCHYKGNSNYPGMQSAYTSSGLSIPPEITSGSWNGKPGYYNHTLSDYTDSQCKSCHDKAGSTTVGQLTHNVSIGTAGGPDCKACHDVGGSAPKLINFNVANNSAHKNLNSGASSTVDAQDKKCWACHGDGIQPVSGHPSNYKTPAPCENCHTGTGRYSAPLVTEHIPNGTDVQVTASCKICHNNSGMLIDGGGIGTITHYTKNVTDTTTTPYGHSGTIDTTNCLICHNGPYTGNASWGSPVNITTSLKRKHTETTNAQCDSCHKDNTVSTLANVDFHNASLSSFGPNCLGCHAGVE